MLSAPIETVIKMMEPLPETAQNLIVERMRDYIEEMRDDIRWESLFSQTENNLIKAARRAKLEIAEGHSEPMDLGKL